MFRILFFVFYRTKVKGLEHIPKEGAIIFCPNHLSNFDPPLVAAMALKKRRVHFMAKSELFQTKIFGFILKHLRAFPVKRGEGDRQALKLAMQTLNDGRCLGIFPEGKRGKLGELLEPSAGAASLALKTKAQLIPVAIHSEYKLFKPTYITFGKPLSLSSYEGVKTSSQDAKDVINEVMKEIQCMLDDVKK